MPDEAERKVLLREALAHLREAAAELIEIDQPVALEAIQLSIAAVSERLPLEDALALPKAKPQVAPVIDDADASQRAWELRREARDLGNRTSALRHEFAERFSALSAAVEQSLRLRSEAWALVTAR